MFSEGGGGLGRNLIFVFGHADIGTIKVTTSTPTALILFAPRIDPDFPWVEKMSRV